MTYQGYLLKIGNYVFPKKYISAESYKAYVNMQDLDPWVDADGYEHRNALELKALKVELNTVNMLSNTQFKEIMDGIRTNYIVAKERSFMITAYIPEYDDYVTQKGYLADFTPEMYWALEDKIEYKPIRLAFIGGVAE